MDSILKEDWGIVGATLPLPEKLYFCDVLLSDETFIMRCRVAPSHFEKQKWGRRNNRMDSILKNNWEIVGATLPLPEKLYFCNVLLSDE